MALTEDFLNAFFSRTESFFLTGGNALNLFYFHHRPSEDFDCFTTDPLEYGRIIGIIDRVCRAIGATFAVRQDFTDFKRFLITRGNETAMIDCVNETVPQLYPVKKIVGEVRIDLPEEMTANKLCALVGRSEYKDLIDLYFLQKNGYPAISFLPQAAKKDGGINSSVLAYVLGQFNLAKMPESLKTVVPLSELESFRTELLEQLLKDSFPAT
jgi:hypothetical protein